MKRVTVLVLVLFLITCGAAMAGDKDPRIEKGAGFLGVNTSIAFTNFLAADPTVYAGYFVANGFELGPVLTANYTQDVTTNKPKGGGDKTTETDTSSLFGIGLQGAYIYPASNFFSIYGQVILEYASSAEKAETKTGSDKQSDTTNLSGLIAEPKFGFMFFLTRNFAIDTALFYRYSSMSGKNTTQDAGGKVKFNTTDLKSDFGFIAGLDFCF